MLWQMSIGHMLIFAQNGQMFQETFPSPGRPIWSGSHEHCNSYPCQPAGTVVTVFCVSVNMMKTCNCIIFRLV